MPNRHKANCGAGASIPRALQAWAGPGKSAVLAWYAWNLLGCYGDKGEHPKGAAVSITNDLRGPREVRTNAPESARICRYR